MNDITALAQREKFEAWAEEVGALPWGILKKHRNQDGSYPGPHYSEMWKAWQAASEEMVEALEKAQQRIDELESKLAKPVLLPRTNGYWTEQEKAYEEAITLAKRQIRLAGFQVIEGEQKNG